MPNLVLHIDQIAREKQRDVLFLVFKETQQKSPDDLDFWFDYQNCTARKEIRRWLTAHHIAHWECAGFASENSMVPYMGQLYIDVPFDTNSPQYQELAAHLENPDGSGKIPGLLFCYLRLEMALKNAHHDAPGFWEKWAEDF